MTDDLAGLLAAQVAYYGQRAGEYDQDMWQRHSSDPDLVAMFTAIDRWFKPLPVRGRVLELGCGTGAWTGPLAARAETVVAVDAAAQMLDVARARTEALDNVEFVQADVFTWQPPARVFDVVFSSFLYSHVPPDREEVFWELIEQALGTGGLVAIIDAAPQRASEENWVEGRPHVAQRRLRDGSVHHIVKVLRQPEAIAASMRARGWSANVDVIDERILVADTSQAST